MNDKRMNDKRICCTHWKYSEYATDFFVEIKIVDKYAVLLYINEYKMYSKLYKLTCIEKRRCHENLRRRCD